PLGSWYSSDMVGTLAGSPGRASLGRVRVRIPVPIVAALLLAATFALSGCGPATVGRAAPLTAAPGAGGPSAAPIPAGRAPSRAFEVATRTDTFTRDGTRTLKTTAWYPK